MLSITAAALSGLIGALAGGGISLVSQILHHRWEKKAAETLYKKELYSKIAGIGSEYISKEAYRNANCDIARALLVSGGRLMPKLVEYAASIEQDNKHWNDQGFNRQEATNINVRIHGEMVKLMREELGTRETKGQFLEKFFNFLKSEMM